MRKKPRPQRTFNIVNGPTYVEFQHQIRAREPRQRAAPPLSPLHKGNTMYAANAGRRLATSCVLLGGSLEYAKTGGRSAVARCARLRARREKEPPKEEEQEEEEGLERYLGYSAALARLKLVMLRAKTALGHAARRGPRRARPPAAAAQQQQLEAPARPRARPAPSRGAAARGGAAARAPKRRPPPLARRAPRAKAAVGDAARYVAYSSDVGESMRPVLRPWMVNATYGVAIGYVLYDAGRTSNEKWTRGIPTEVLLATGTYKLVFHGLVSLAMPAVIIHSAVHQAHDLFAREAFSKMPRVVKWGPSAVGLGLIPLMPCSIRRRSAWRRSSTPWPAWRIGEKPHHDGFV